MTEPKKESTAEDADWADALDEWEQKAFSSMTPPPPTASVPPEAAGEPEAAAPTTGVKPTAHHDDRTLAS